MRSIDENTTADDGDAAASSTASSSNPHLFAQWLVAKYGLYFCTLVYIILALQRPTILGFVFMSIVMVGAVLPDFVFRACAPVLLVYTGGYAAAVYWFGSVAIRKNYFGAEAEKLLEPIGLVIVDPFSKGWLVAGIPLCMVTLLGFTWRYRENKTTMTTPAAASAPSARSLAVVPPKENPPLLFSVGYMILLAVMPLAFVVSKSYRIISRQAFPRLFRAMAVYAGIVLCLVHIFCADGLMGISLDDFIGGRLRDDNAPEDKSRAKSFMALNWVVQFLAVTQTEILRRQDVNLRQQFGKYPLLMHALKQVLPFALAIVTFAFTWEYISLFGLLVLYLGILSAVVGRTMTIVWRLTVVVSVLVALVITIFDFRYFESYSFMPVLYWVGFRRGQYVPNPDVSRKSAVPNAAKGCWCVC
eukprot:evm.model.NODE_37437_length_30217_cov_24.682034.8